MEGGRKSGRKEQGKGREREKCSLNFILPAGREEDLNLKIFGALSWGRALLSDTVASQILAILSSLDSNFSIQ
jgi:hypothetical protein